MTFTLIHKNYRHLLKYPKLWRRQKLGHGERLMLSKNICQQFCMRRGKVCAAEELSGCGAFFAQPHLACCFNREPREGARIRIIISVGVCSSSFMYHQIPVSCPVNAHYLDLFWASLCSGRGEAKSSSDIPSRGVISYKHQKLQTPHQQWPLQKPGAVLQEGGALSGSFRWSFVSCRGECVV